MATGKPKILDRTFDPASTLVEERIVLFESKNSDDAMDQAEAEAEQYCRRIRYMNIYGQSVELKFLGALDAFMIFDRSPCSGCEVYSSTAIVPISVADKTIVNERFGKVEKPGADERYKFIDGDILRGALAATGLRKPGQRSGAKKRRK